MNIIVNTFDSIMPVIGAKVPINAKLVEPTASKVKISVIDNPEDCNLIAEMNINIVYYDPKNSANLYADPDNGISEGIVQEVNSDRFIPYAMHSDFPPVLGYIKDVTVSENSRGKGIFRTIIHELPTILANALNVALTSTVINNEMLSGEGIEKQKMEHFLLNEGFRPLGDEYMSVLYSIR